MHSMAMPSLSLESCRSLTPSSISSGSSNSPLMKASTPSTTPSSPQPSMSPSPQVGTESSPNKPAEEAKKGAQAKAQQQQGNPARARVVWVGNVRQGLHHEELRDIFRVALAFRPDVRVTHVTVQYQNGKPCNSATVFLNRSVDLAKLQQALRADARQPKLKVRKCKNKKKKQRKWKHTEVASSPAMLAKAAVVAFLEKESLPLPAEVGAGTSIFADFMRTLEQGDEDAAFATSLNYLFTSANKTSGSPACH